MRYLSVTTELSRNWEIYATRPNWKTTRTGGLEKETARRNIFEEDTMNPMHSAPTIARLYLRISYPSGPVRLYEKRQKSRKSARALGSNYTYS